MTSKITTNQLSFGWTEAETLLNKIVVVDGATVLLVTPDKIDKPEIKSRNKFLGHYFYSLSSEYGIVDFSDSFKVHEADEPEMVIFLDAKNSLPVANFLYKFGKPTIHIVGSIKKNSSVFSFSHTCLLNGLQIADVLIIAGWLIDWISVVYKERIRPSFSGLDQAIAKHRIEVKKAVPSRARTKLKPWLKKQVKKPKA